VKESLSELNTHVPLFTQTPLALKLLGTEFQIEFDITVELSTNGQVINPDESGVSPNSFDMSEGEAQSM
jgi:hypothetical protein